jgi:glycosyltransferase involved in cell wall biosynthesis
MVTTVLPDPSRGGGEVVTAGFVGALRRAGADVDVVGLLRPGDAIPAAPDGVRFHVAGRRPIETVGAARRHQAAWAVRALLRGEPFSAAKYRSPGQRRMVAKIGAWDVAVVDHLQMAWMAPRLGRPLVLLAHNHEGAVYATLAREARGIGGNVWRREQRLVDALERRASSSADEVWALTELDAAPLRRAASRVRVFAVPGAAATPARPGPAAGGHVAVLGTWTWGPNLAGLRWLFEDVVPRLAGELEIVVGGRGAELLGSPPPGVRLVGRVPDAGEFLGSAGAVAVPAVAGSGVQVKTIDAIASGAPVVVTSVALRGIDDPPSQVRVADDAAGFAAALRDATATGRSDAGPRWAAARAARFDEDVARALRELAGPRSAFHGER